MAERLPVGLIPEQTLVALMRNDMIHVGGRRSAYSAQWMLSQKYFPGFCPSRIVPPFIWSFPADIPH